MEPIYTTFKFVMSTNNIHFSLIYNNLHYGVSMLKVCTTA